MLKTSLLIFFLILYILFGAGITIILKHINNEESKGVKFSHDYFITLLMFFSEISGLPLYCILSRKSKKSERTDSQSVNDEAELQIEEELEDNNKISNKKKVLYSIIPFILDNIASYFSGIVINYLSGSTYMMIKGLTIIIFTLLLSKFLLKNKHIIDHYIAIACAGVGCIFIGINKSLYKDSETKEIIVGIIIVVIIMVTQSFQCIYQEYYMKKYMIDQFFMLGFEGLFGFIFNIILCISFYYIECDESTDFGKYYCIKDDKGILRLENLKFCFIQIFDNKIILTLIIILIIVIAGFNLIGISIIKYNGSVTRCLIDNIKIFLVWIYFLFPWINEDLKDKFDWQRLLGLIFTLASILIYFGIFKIDEKITIRRRMRELSLKEDALVISRESSINEKNE